MKPIQKDLLYVKIADAIMEYIRDNHLKSGDKLPSERVLAQEFSTSRNSVREALRVLEKDQVIEVKTGKGTFITSNEAKDSFYMKVWKVNYGEFLEVRRILDLHIIRSLCGTITPEQIEAVEEPLQKLEEGRMFGKFLQHEDYLFHSRLCHFCSNSTLEQILDNIRVLLKQYGQEMENTGLWIDTIPYHRDMLEAIKKNKPFAAEQAYDKIYQIDKNVLEQMQNKKS